MPNALNHVAVIADGNGRWARRRGLSRSEGHTEGRKRIEDLVSWCIERGIRYLSVYTLSLDNLKRDEAEVRHICQLATELCNDRGIQNANKKGVRIVLCGNRDMMQQADREVFERAEQATEDNDRLTLMLQFYYGGRDEIVQAANACLADGAEITTEALSERMYAAKVCAPDPDLIVRTGGYFRMSDYLLWQGDYSELYFMNTLFPDLSKEEFMWACKCYEGIRRNNGLIDEQIMAPETQGTKAAKGRKSHGAPFAKKGETNGTAEKEG